MEYYKSYKDVPKSSRDHVIAIGNFDGVHKGHQTLIAQAGEQAKTLDAPLGVLTFEPHPRRLFRPDEPPSRITPPALKADRLKALGVDTLFSVPFDWDFASQPYEDFIKNVLTDGLGAKHVVVGDDFCFGQMRKGCPVDIQSAGLPTTIVTKVAGTDERVFSSSRIRQHLRSGEIDQANAILGWEWEVHGEVIKGDQRGRELGYPTANMKLGETIHPAYGVYAARVQIEGENEWHSAAINIGIRPMFEIPLAQVESFIFDFDRDIYGKTLRVKPVQRLRSEAKFNSLDDLIIQMAKDCEQAKSILA